MTVSKPAAIMPRRLPLCWIFTLLLLAACGSEPVKNQAQYETKPARPAAAASIQRKPQPVPTDQVKSYGLGDSQTSQRLLNADTYVQAGDTASAQKQLDLINQAELSTELRSKFYLLDAQIALSMGDAEAAVQKLDNIRPRLLADSDKVAYYQSLAFAQALQGNVLPAVSARIQLGNLLKQPAQQQANIAAILDMLSVLPADSLNATPALAQELGGWLELAKLLKQRDQPGGDLDGQIRQWQLRYPGHPANAEFLRTYLNAPQLAAADAGEQAAQEAPPQNPAKGPAVAVLLPASGPYAQAAKAIREGLVAAHRLAGTATPQLPLKFYDTEQGGITELYQQALAEGAQQVIGPLVKEQIQALAYHGDLSVPVLALNHVENLTKANLYQFGLSPIDEAEQLALKARHDGRQSAIILTPNNSQGQRISRYLALAWQNGGGTIVGEQSYDPKQHDIATMLNALIATPPELNVTKTPQTVLLSASPEVARELAPQLQYHQSADLAVYAMPNVYSGRQNPSQDSELGKVTFCDIPWLFPNVYDGPLGQAALQSTWQGLSESSIRLLALGIDAYNLLGQLNQLSTTPYAGATGRLSLNGENRVTRKLVCAQFKGGVPVPSGYLD